ncbi:hypothetical protein HDV00_008574 [Rhizophlyctis rosea]|nr:hypothetical protein HDV00_008574 [Rhizophlyctis rosea]
MTTIHPIDGLPLELLCQILQWISTAERARASAVSRRWAAAVADARELVVKATPLTAVIGLGRILERFPRLEKFELRFTGRTESEFNALVSTGKTFTGHSTLTHITADTSAVMTGLSNCPQLRYLSLTEDYAVPVTHLLEFRGNAVRSIFKDLAEQLTELHMDTPLLWAVDKFSEWRSRDWNDEDVGGAEGHVLTLSRLRKLSVGSLHTESAGEFFVGYLSRIYFPNLTEVSIKTDDAFIPARHLSILRTSCPNLSTLELQQCALEARDLEACVGCLPRSLKCLRLKAGDFPAPRFVGGSVGVVGNAAKRIVMLLVRELSLLEALEIMHCRFKVPGSAFAAGGMAEFLDERDEDDDEIDEGVDGSRLRTLVLMGFGKLLKDITFIGRFSNLRVLKVDDIHHDVGGPHASGRRSRLSWPRQLSWKSSVWQCLGARLPNAEEIELRYTAASAREDGDVDQVTEYVNNYISPHERMESMGSTWKPPLHGGSSAMDVIMQPLRLADPTFANLMSLSLYAPVSIQFLFSVLYNRRNLRALKLSYIPAANVDDLHQQGQQSLHLTGLKSLQIHVHGTQGPHVAKGLMQLLTADARGLTFLRVVATKPMVGLGLNEDREMTYSLPMDEWTIDMLIQTCPNIRTLRIAGLPFNVAAMWRLCGGRYGTLKTWAGTLTHFEVPFQSSAHNHTALLQKLISQHRLLKTFDLCIDALHTLPLQSDTKYHHPSSILAPPAEPISPHTTAEVIADIRRRDAHYGRLCAEMTEELKDGARWLGVCKVWTPNIRQHRIRTFLLRRLQDRRRRELADAAAAVGVGLGGMMAMEGGGV